MNLRMECNLGGPARCFVNEREVSFADYLEATARAKALEKEPNLEALLAAAERRGRRAGLEEAAQVADDDHRQWDHGVYARQAAQRIAAAIRALAGEETEK
jgi:pantoate kinase